MKNSRFLSLFPRSLSNGFLCLLAFLMVSACGGENQKSGDKTPVTNEQEDAKKPDVNLTPEPEEAKSDSSPKPREKLQPTIDIPADDAAIQGLPKVKMDTSLGPITVVLYPEQAPISVENFLTYVKASQYSRTIFHRVIPGFMVQGGGFSIYLEQRRTRDPIVYEGDNGLSNERGTLAMARRSDPNSATAQWYINHEDNENLNHQDSRPGYTVFGRVISGMNIVDEIAFVPTSTQTTPTGQDLANVPVEPIIIEKVTIVE